MKKLMFLSSFLALSGCYAHHERCVERPTLDLGEGPVEISFTDNASEFYPGCVLEVDETGLLPGACMIGEYEFSWDAGDRIGEGSCSAIETDARLYRYFGTDAHGVVDAHTYERTLVLSGI